MKMNEGQREAWPGSKAHCLAKSSGVCGGRYSGPRIDGRSNGWSNGRGDHAHKEDQWIPTDWKQGEEPF